MKNIVSRQSRIEAYARQEGPKGEGRDEKNLQKWATRAERNSEIAPRASSEMKLHSTGKMDSRDTSMGPKVSRKVDARSIAKNDLNHDPDSSPFMKSVRRGQS